MPCRRGPYFAKSVGRKTNVLGGSRGSAFLLALLVHEKVRVRDELKEPGRRPVVAVAVGEHVGG